MIRSKRFKLIAISKEFQTPLKTRVKAAVGVLC